MKSVAKQKGACAKMGKYKLNDEGPATSSMPHPTDFLAQHEEGNFKRNKNIFRAHTSFGPATKPKLKVSSIMANNKTPVPTTTAPVVVTPKKEPIPSDIADQLQTSKNERAAADYEKRKAGIPAKKAGGCVKMSAGGSASSRGDGCCVKGKTKGRIC